MSLYPNRRQRQGFGAGYQGGIAPIGIEYQQTAPEIADLEGIMMLDQRRREADTLHAAEAEKLKPDEERYRQMIANLDLFSGQRDALVGGLEKNISALKDKVRKNRDYIFSDEGAAEIASIESLVNESNLKKSAQQYATKTQELLAAKNKGIANRTIVRNGQFLILDKEDGQQIWIDAENAGKLIEEDPERYQQIKTIQGAYNRYNKLEDPGVIDMDLSQGVSRDEAYQAISNAFASTGMTSDDNPASSWRNNKAQLATAKQAAKDALTSEQIDALRSDYIEQSGDTSTQGFNSHLNRLLDQEMQKRIVSDATEKSPPVEKASKSGSGEEGSEDERFTPVVIPVNTGVNVIADSYNGTNKTVAITGKVANPVANPVEERMILDGGYYHFEDTNMFTGDKTSENGNFINKRKVLDLAKVTDYVYMPITTGNVHYLKTKKVSKQLGKHLAIMDGDESAIEPNMEKGKQYGRSPATGEWVTYYESADDPNVWIEVKEVGAKVIQGFKQDDSGEYTEAGTYFAPLSQQESVKYLGANATFERTQAIPDVKQLESPKGKQLTADFVTSNYAYLDQQFKQAETAGDVEMQKKVISNYNSLKKLYARFASESLSVSEKKELMRLLNEFSDTSLVKSILDSQVWSKGTFTSQDGARTN